MDLGLEILMQLFVGFIGFVVGLLVENAFDLINSKKKETRLKSRIRMALDCVFEAEEQITGEKMGAEKLELATKLYQERAGVRKYEEAHGAIMQAFTVSKLDRNGHTL